MNIRLYKTDDIGMNLLSRNLLDYTIAFLFIEIIWIICGNNIVSAENYNVMTDERWG